MYVALAGVLSQKMGFPIKLISTVTENDILARTYQHGDFSSDEVVAATLAPAMDIQVIQQMKMIEKSLKINFGSMNDIGTVQH